MKKVLFSVLLIAMIASMVGAGTWAYFSDLEHSEDNCFTAGSLDLKVDGEDDPNVATYFAVECVAPGDSGEVEITLTNAGCVDGYGDIHFIMNVNSDNGFTEPEDDVVAPNNDNWDGTADGDLCDVLEITVKADTDRNGSFETTIFEDQSMCSIDCVNWDLGSIPGTDFLPLGSNWIDIKISWYVPVTVGNIIQTDICCGDIEFSLHQTPIVAVLYDLTVVSDGCCPIDVGPPVNQTVAAGATETYVDIMEGVTVSVDAYEPACCDFVEWTGDINAASTSNPNSVTMDADSTVTATCVEPTYDLVVNSVGCCPIDVGAPISATVAAGASQTFTDIDCGTVISLDADDSAPDCTFTSWTGGVDLGAGVNPNEVTMDGDKTVNGNCQGVGYNLTVTSDGCCPIDVGAPVNQTVAAGASQTFIDIPGGTDVSVSADDSDPCCDFVSWDDAGAQTHDVTMDANKSVTATCVWDTSNLTVDQTGSCCDVNVGAPISVTVPAGGSQTFTDVDCCTTVSLTAVEVTPECCDFVDWSGPVGNAASATTDVHVGVDDVTVSANCVWLDSDLTVNSIGCCLVEVEYDSVLVYTVQPGESWTDVDVPCCTDVDITAIPPPPECVCDDIELDGVSIGCLTGYVHMDGIDHVFDVYCHEEELPPVPEPCCWCIYLAEWWQGATPDTSVPADNVEYFCLHCEELLPAGHTEPVGAPFPGGVHVIPDPSFHQEFQGFAGPAPNGYGLPEWTPLLPPTTPGTCRYNSILTLVYATGMGYWNSQLDMVNWKTRFDVTTPLGPIVLYSGTLMVIPVVGNPGWPYALGNTWISVGMSSITPPSASVNIVVGQEMVDCGGSVPPTMCFVVQGNSWADADGVDDDGDLLIDEDPMNGYDDDADGLTDEDGGDGVPQPGELTLSSVNWYSNDYGCALKKETYPGALYLGQENLCLLWYCVDPPFPPFQ